MFKKDDEVVIKGTTLRGVVSAVKFDEDTGEKRIFVKWTNDAGEEHEREFNADALVAA